MWNYYMIPSPLWLKKTKITIKTRLIPTLKKYITYTKQQQQQTNKKQTQTKTNQTQKQKKKLSCVGINNLGYSLYQNIWNLPNSNNYRFQITYNKNKQNTFVRFYRDLNSDRWIQSPEC